MKLSKKPDSSPFSKRVKTRLNKESVELFIDDESSKESQLQFVNFIKSTKFPQVEIESDGSSTSSSANGSSSSCEERERLKNPKSNLNYLKSTTSSEKKKMNLQVSDLTDSETSSVSFDDKKFVLRNTKSKSCPSFKRNTSMRTLRILMNKSKKGNCVKVPEGDSVIRTTCSSALKDSKIPIVEVEPEERESEKISALRVCSYTYCSLHGQHTHSSTPPLKRLLSKRRRFSKTQKVLKSSTNDLVKDTKTKQLVVNEDFKGRKKGKNSKVVSGKSKVKVAKGDEIRNTVEIYPNNSESTYDEVAKNNESGDGKKKRMSMWYLIHQQMVSGLVEGRDNQEMDIPKSGSKNTEMENQEIGIEYERTENQEISIENKEKGNQNIEIQKIYATKMVREAIEKILLPEVSDQSPDDVSICSEQEPSEKQDPSGDQQQGESAKKKAPKSWSNLKKLILLKRFVKELEKVRKINPRKPKLMLMGSDQEGEKMNLRHNGLDKKKSAEEWMLDYALQQAVSELAPTQKRKVELLIKAFENVVPPVDGEQNPLSFPKFKSISKEPNVLVEGKANQGDESNSSEQSQDVDGVINDQSEDDSEELLAVAISNGSSCPDNRAIEQFTKEEEVDSLETVVTANDRKFSLNESTSGKLEFVEVALNSDLKHGPIIDSETENGPLQAFKSRFTKPKNMSMWHLIHQQMVAGLDDENKKEKKKENNEGSCGTNTVSEYDEMENQEVELRKVFAIKMVREAIEKILLPECDDQSTTSETVSEQELTEKKKDEDWGSQIFNSFDSTKEDPTHYSTNKVMYDNDMFLTQDGEVFGSAKKTKLLMEKDESKIEKRGEKQAPKRWSNLKKWIVLQRFVKALEKVKDFNPKKPQLLPLKVDPEGEVVRLKNQMTNGKKSAEEWMLDYALRKVVSELAPKQKKKVELLVKAFETVVPPTEEMKSPVITSKFKSTEGVKKLKNVFTAKIDDGNNDSANTVEKSDVVSRSPFKDAKLDGLSSDASGEWIASKVDNNIILGFSSTGKLTNKAQSEKHMKMWHLLCQHVVSEIAVKVEDDNTTFDQQNINDDRSLEFSKSDAVKLVKDAIDEILVPGIQDDSSDTVSIASDISLDQDLLEEKKPRNWDKLKKLILLKRSIKALEKVRRSDPRAPRHLTLDSGREEEKVDLKRRLSDEKKKAEEWMMDYAVQHIVTKLTPDRKRRVSMLVEAFEAVVPLPQI